MKKILKGSLIVLGIVIGVFVIGIGAIILHGPGDPIILTQEEEQIQNDEQIVTYANTNLDGFNTHTINGEEVTSSIFSEYKITMVNIWYTGCSPCIAEMPEIEKLYNDIPSDCNILTICTDLLDQKGNIDKDGVEFAKKVMSDAEAEFMTLIPDEVLIKQISDKTRIFPTTIFVDSNGNIVGTPHFGERTANEYKNAIVERLKLLDENENN